LVGVQPVDAGAADAFALDEGDRLAGGGDPPRHWRPRLTGADHDRVEPPVHRSRELLAEIIT
jgi:hypothetical protein